MKERGLRSSRVSPGGCWGCSRSRRRRPLMEAYAGQQFVGMDLHRRRTVLVRMTAEGEVLERVRIVNDAGRLAAMGLRPEEAVHVGDDVVADVAGSKGIGMRAVWFNNGVAAEHAVHVWPASIDARPDAEIRDCRDLPGILEAWR